MLNELMSLFDTDVHMLHYYNCYTSVTHDIFSLTALIAISKCPLTTLYSSIQIICETTPKHKCKIKMYSISRINLTAAALITAVTIYLIADWFFH